MADVWPTMRAAAELIRGGRLTATKLVEQCLAQIDRWEAQLRAWVLVDRDGALAEAERLDQLARRQSLRGPLHGIPLGIKDIIDVAELPTLAGSPLRAGHRAERDAPVVARLRRQGAIVLGKTVTTEFACFDPSPTRNPWNPDHTPGGSSSGSAAAVAAGMCLGALGSQTGGSIIRPASYCGVAGLKPRFGRVPLEGVVPVSPRLDHVGPLARCVDDLTILLAAISGSPLAGWPPAEHRFAKPPGQSFGLIEQLFFERASDDVRQVTRAAVERLREAGAAVQPLSLPADFDRAITMHRRIMAAEAAAYHREQFQRHRDQYGPKIATLIEEGLACSDEDLADALGHQNIFRQQMRQRLAGGLIALMPATPTTAPAGLESTGDPSFNSPWSYAGLPAVTIPCGLGKDALPCGLQLVADADEFELLDAAAWCEWVLGFDARPPLASGGR